MSQNQEPETDSMRADKWLWCARFFKTRSTAAEALRKGKVKVNNTRVKPSRTVKPGDNLTIRKGVYTYVVEVTALAPSRLPAVQAGLLYKEDKGSVKQRQQLASELKMSEKVRPRTKGRPTKRERRELIRFTRRGG